MSCGRYFPNLERTSSLRSAVIGFTLCSSVSPVLKIFHSIPRLRISRGERCPGNRNHQKAQHAPLRPNHATRKPPRPMKRRLQQMSRKDRSTIRHRIEKCLSPIPRSVKSHRKPQVPGAPHSQAKEKPNCRGGQQSWPLLSAISHMDQSEYARQQHSRWPEAHGAGQSKLRIPAQQEFFKESHQQKKHRPEKSEPHNAHSMDRQMSHIKNAQSHTSLPSTA